jgi:hypothetical protein
LLWRSIKLFKLNQLELKWLIKAYQTTNDKSKFFNPFLPNLQELKITTANRSRISEVKSEKAGRKD